MIQYVWLLNHMAKSNHLTARLEMLDQHGEVAERSKAQHWKCCIEATLSRVRIPPSPFTFTD